MKIHGTMEVINQDLLIGKVSCTDLCNEYKTPLYVYDEELIRKNCRDYISNFQVKKRGNKIAYAGKAFLTKAMCRLVLEEGLFLDVVSGGELYTAYKAGFDMSKIFFHGNNKTDEEIRMGVSYNIGKFVVDNETELAMIEQECKLQDKTQEIFFRITPGIEAHTHDYIKTGQIDSKFGFAISNGDFLRVIEKMDRYPHIKIVGLHAHIGSQIFEIQPYLDLIEIMLDLSKGLKQAYDIEIRELDLGGGFGVYYTRGDKNLSTKKICEAILKKADEACKKKKMNLPTLILEPGRSIVANAGSTLYKIGSIKEVTDVRTYVSVDGGMSDNIRPSLYHANYECAIVNKMRQRKTKKVTIAGKCCESGDILIHDVILPTPSKGDILIVPSTGAYGYSMASNYNKAAKPAVVMVNNGKSKIIVKRQSFDDLLELEE